ncbi:hypothetical protein O1611_g3407 [Lasiodiplodia mahajangana]|uniref:Uncharacterized protein n=1 Tax=Lasiodiplodia mahajangana TaxID=1108764 RepID=A0ACC2JRV8_9PEZI|nr:hypothetical protein O1611_g3407 [Lasiodiplodia mahajangana]
MPSPQSPGNPPSAGSASPRAGNTSLFITGLPKDVTFRELFDGAHHTGKVKHAHITKTDARHPNTHAAHIIYFAHISAQRLFDRAAKGEFFVRGIRPFVIWNRRYTAEDRAIGRSRALRIIGPAEIVNRESLESFWRRRQSGFYWNTDIVIETKKDSWGEAIVFYYFASWENQAVKAANMLAEAFNGVVWVSYTRDLCEDGVYEW